MRKDCVLTLNTFLLFFCGLIWKNRQVLLVLSELYGMDPDELAEICYQNSLRVFFPEELTESEEKM